jgi:hypothetical protein
MGNPRTWSRPHDTVLNLHPAKGYFAILRAEIDKWGPILKKAGVYID